jgi:hypothetical protein
MATIAPLPIERTHRLWIEQQAGRIAYGLAGASRKKVRTEIVVGLRMRGVGLGEANKQADRAIVYLDARIDQLRLIRTLSPFTRLAATG